MAFVLYLLHGLAVIGGIVGVALLGLFLMMLLDEIV